ncbi:flagella synthesis protein FlgN [Martelella alba]|uniref:Flagellar biosynthesis protein FlgN n=1 Tax=Martelella alba TaxID=2590451 RepID=A0ABY2SQQ1_9HYPH|nr:flagellar export chaperone FlgN [Martelella alba]TKI08301.1 flagellar biosynthesis protein FlgN [Martelella alba]
MNDLELICAKMLGILQQLELILVEEQRLLSAGRVNAALLHRVTENKNEELATLQHADSLRQKTALIRGAGQPPYEAYPELQRLWQSIRQLTEKLSHDNFRNGLLLNQHLQHNQQILAVLEERQIQRRLYGPDGQSQSSHILGRKFSV